MAGILAVLALQGNRASSAGEELLGLAAALSQADGGELRTLLLGEGAQAAAEAAVVPVGTQVLWSADAALLRFPGEAGAAAIVQAAQEAQADLVLLAADTRGRDWAPRVAARLGAGLVTDATEVRREDGRIVATRPVFGGKAIARMAPTGDRAVITLRPGAGGILAGAQEGGGVPLELALRLTPAPGWPEVVARADEASEGPRLEEAKAIVAGGRGIGGPEGFAVLAELADALQGAVGASRAAVDEGWVPAAWQIGQTGKAVAPDLYIAVGISGASQHMVGCSRAKTLVAINSDPDALIFGAARLGVVADWREAVPALTRALRESS